MIVTKEDIRFIAGLLPALVVIAFAGLLLIVLPEAGRWTGGYAFWLVGLGSRPRLANLSMRLRIAMLFVLALFFGAAVPVLSALALFFGYELATAVASGAAFRPPW